MRVLLFFIFFYLTCCMTALAAPVNQIAAVVNGEMITTYDLEKACRPVLQQNGISSSDPSQAEAINQIRRNVLDTLINDLLVEQEAVRMKITVSDKEVENEIKQIMQREKLSEAEFAKELSARGYSLNDYKITIKKNLLGRELLGHMVARKVIVTKEEIENYYNEHSDVYDAGRQVRFAVIVYPSEVQAKEWAPRVSSGQIPFAEAVKRVSVGPMKDQGGDLGIMDWSDLAPDVKSHISPLKIDEVSSIMLLNGMPAQLKLLDSRSGGRSQSLDEVKEQIEATLRQPKMQERFVEYLEQLRKKAVINIRL